MLRFGVLGCTLNRFHAERVARVLLSIARLRIMLGSCVLESKVYTVPLVHTRFWTNQRSGLVDSCAGRQTWLVHTSDLIISKT